MHNFSKCWNQELLGSTWQPYQLNYNYLMSLSISLIDCNWYPMDGKNISIYLSLTHTHTPLFWNTIYCIWETSTCGTCKSPIINILNDSMPYTQMHLQTFFFIRMRMLWKTNLCVFYNFPQALYLQRKFYLIINNEYKSFTSRVFTILECGVRMVHNMHGSIQTHACYIWLHVRMHSSAHKRACMPNLFN